MKKVEELGISPAPWSACTPTKREVAVACLKDDEFRSVQAVALCRAEGRNADARLIAAAPELYKALYDDVTFYCEHCLDVHNATECPQKSGGTCQIMEWRKLLEKAGGVE